MASSGLSWFSSREPACNAGDMGSIPRLGRSPGEGTGNPLHILAWETPGTEEPGGLPLRTQPLEPVPRPRPAHPPVDQTSPFRGHSATICRTVLVVTCKSEPVTGPWSPEGGARLARQRGIWEGRRACPLGGCLQAPGSRGRGAGEERGEEGGAQPGGGAVPASFCILK